MISQYTAKTFMQGFMYKIQEIQEILFRVGYNQQITLAQSYFPTNKSKK